MHAVRSGFAGRSRFAVWPGFLACLGSLSPAVAAPPKLNYFFPAGAQRGQTIVVTASGSWDAWPVNAWVDRQGVELVAEPEQKGKFRAIVSPGASPGVYWLRLTHSTGASAIKPFLVGTLPEVEEQEPNDDPDRPQRIMPSTIVNGRLGKRADVDTIAIPLRQGQTVVASLLANELLGSAVDGVLQICSPDRFVLDQNDDARGIDPQLTFTAPRDGEYLVRVFGFPATPNSTIAFAGDDAYLYRLTIAATGFIDHALPLAVTRGQPTDVELHGWAIPDAARRFAATAGEEPFVSVFHPDLAGWANLPVLPHPCPVAQPDCGPEHPQAIEVPSTVTGVIEAALDVDVFSFTAQKGTTIDFAVESDQLGFLLDGALTVTDPAGKVLAEVDDAKRARDPELVFTAPADGAFRLAIRDVHGHGGARYVYRLTAQLSQPRYELNVAADVYQVKPGESVKLDVTVDRIKGFDRDLEVTVVGLPAGLQCAPVKSLGTGDSAKKVQLVLDAATAVESGTVVVSGSFEIVGRSASPETGPTTDQVARCTASGLPDAWTRLWVTVIDGTVAAEK